MKLIIKGKQKYVKYLAGHLKIEHPATRKLIRVVK